MELYKGFVIDTWQTGLNQRWWRVSPLIEGQGPGWRRGEELANSFTTVRQKPLGGHFRAYREAARAAESWINLNRRVHAWERGQLCQVRGFKARIDAVPGSDYVNVEYLEGPNRDRVEIRVNISELAPFLGPAGAES